MKLLACWTAVCTFLLTTALANTEKVIFVAPPSIRQPDAAPGLEALGLDRLSPTEPNLRASLSVAFPSEARPRGLDHWYLLEGLNKGQRYEVRICWVATAQPTEFWISTHIITHVFDTPALIQSLSSYSEQLHSPELDARSSPQPIASEGTVLFLHVQSAADYFTSNKTLMQQPPPVDVDIILDPYLVNIFPQSLVPTAVYLLILAPVAWFASAAVWNFIQSHNVEKQHSD